MGWFQHHWFWRHPFTWTFSRIFTQVRLAGQEDTSRRIFSVGNVCLWFRSSSNVRGTELDGRTRTTSITLHRPVYTWDLSDAGIEERRSRGSMDKRGARETLPASAATFG
ncbi:hypothetical protein Dimus_030978 [Dionaea muscipula]